MCGLVWSGLGYEAWKSLGLVALAFAKGELGLLDSSCTIRSVFVSKTAC